MLDKEKLKSALTEYKRILPQRWENEQFKWQAIKWFQENWDENATDFPAMLDRCLMEEKMDILLTSHYFYPRSMIVEFAQADPEEVRSMFRTLYDENRDLAERIRDFKQRAVALFEKRTDDAKNHFQTEYAITVYLWLRYPDRYYIYKYTELAKVIKILGADYELRFGAYEDNIRNFMAFHDELNEALKEDSELVELFQSLLKEDCYPDPELKTLTFDFTFWIGKEGDNEEDDPALFSDSWSPALEVYSPGFSKNDWLKILNNKKIIGPDWGGLLAAFFSEGGTATCSQVAQKYDKTPMSISGMCTQLAKKIQKETKCVLDKRDDGQKRYWSILFQGKKSPIGVPGAYTWRLRKELYDALMEFDIMRFEWQRPQGKPLPESRPVIWKISEGKNYNGVPDIIKPILEKRKVVAVHEATAALAAQTGEKPQGENFISGIKKGDYFYLCYASNVILFGRFNSDNAVICNDLSKDEKGQYWYERSYEIVAKAVLNEKYSGSQKLWAPNFSSTCVKVDDVDLFEELILKPYFHMSLVDLGIRSDTEERHYWWLNANPKFWKFSDITVGDSEEWMLYNDNGHKRKVFQNFLDARKGDLVIGYESSPVKQIVALGVISKEQDGKSISFEKTEGLVNPIDLSTLKTCLELANMEFFRSSQGSLFRMTKEEYEFIYDIIRENNPIIPIQEVDKYTKEDFLKDVFMSDSQYEDLVGVLVNKMNVILQGAPGVGKTFAATRLAWSMMGKKDDSHIEFVQFHQNYSYEDFVMGYKPDEEGFKLKNGIFFQFCQRAAEKPNEKFFFIIDEINRGNMSKVFGELLMLIEKDYRGKSATLAYNGLPFSVPKNLYIIGMMNTADRSLALIDYALRRRFGFFDMEPGFITKGFKEYQASLENTTFNALIEKIRELNEVIANQDRSLGKGFCIGHSYFCNKNKEECTDEWMASIVKYDILPMLREYWFDDTKGKVKRWESELEGVLNDQG